MKTTNWLTVCLMVLLSATNLRAQVFATSMMDLNNVRFRISNSGVLFNNAAAQVHGYEIPKNEGTSIIYAGAMWFGGMDIGGQLKLAAMKYGDGNDYRPGPYSSTNMYDSASYVSVYGSSIWSIAQSEVENHIQNFNTPGYIVPSAIQNWPGNGDPSLGVAEQLAPYVDFNSNGTYDPESGDYPLIKGCRTLYMILNDYLVHTESNAGVIGLELHFMFYQYDGGEPAALANTTFMDVRAINRGTQTVYDFYGGWFLDGDVGNYSDDFAGCDTSRNMAFMYNGDAYDEDFSGLPGYGTEPPAFGMVSLNRPYSSFSVITNSGTFPYADPELATHYYNFLKGRWADGSQMLDDQGQPTQFLYHGDPNVGGSYSEIGQGNPPGDRRIVMAHDLDVLLPNQELNFAYAIVYDRSGAPLTSVENLMLVADSIQEFYDTGSPYCSSLNVGLTELTEQSLAIYPNPSNGDFRVLLPVSDQGTLSVHSVNGEVMKTMSFQGQLIDVRMDGVSDGIYFVKIKGATNYQTHKILLNNH